MDLPTFMLKYIIDCRMVQSRRNVIANDVCDLFLRYYKIVTRTRASMYWRNMVLPYGIRNEMRSFFTCCFILNNSTILLFSILLRNKVLQAGLQLIMLKKNPVIYVMSES